jgi:hypothetical protein
MLLSDIPPPRLPDKKKSKGGGGCVIYFPKLKEETKSSEYCYTPVYKISHA